ncbi:MAG: fumarylacetoacetate hydrolase family protein [Planctomycetes bacterium]|nr:fumarylacetoacetate hydrolase family protein [Planctomycetota bacterium]
MKVTRRLSPEGNPTWIAQRNDEQRDLGAGGLADQLSELAAWLVSPAQRQALWDASPIVEADDWAVLVPGTPGQGLALGKNFAAHAREFGAEPPEELVWFAKLPEVNIGPDEEVCVPHWLTSRVDHEAEVVLLVGAPLHNATLQEAETAIAGYTLGNDITARKQQGLDRDRGWPWLRAKNLATFGPVGPAWVSADAMPPLTSVTLRGTVNGEVRQEASLGDLIWPPAAALAEISRWCPLAPGDWVYLGTPAGVGPIQAGDLLTVEAECLGVLRNPVVATQVVQRSTMNDATDDELQRDRT